MVSSGASENVFVLAFDYRGFGYSTGSPSERGLANDAIAVIQWAIEEAKVPPENIVLVAQSLGTALAAAAVDHFINSTPKIQLGGLLLCATFSDAASVFLSYSPGGILPLLAPLRLFRITESFFARRITDSWKTSDRLVDLVKQSTKFRIVLLHATSDNVIPYRYTEALFSRLVGVAADNGFSERIENCTVKVDLEEGGYTSTWTSDQNLIQKRIVKYGGKTILKDWSELL